MKQLIELTLLGLCVLTLPSVSLQSRCQQWKGRRQRNIWGDFLEDPSCVGPTGERYPRELVNHVASQFPGFSYRNSRILSDPFDMQDKLLSSYRKFNGLDFTRRTARSAVNSSCISPLPDRLCPTEYNTTVPMYGISMTSGEPVTIVQKFPNLLQQVIYEECLSDECDVIHGQCTQNYVPQLFFVLPMGPVTLMGQDYILVEGGCTCVPKLNNLVSSLANQP